jgi:DNA-binding GntR family transcriptional regulator
MATRETAVVLAARERLPADPVPAPQYRRLAELVRELILSGELPLGTRLPSERDLADAASMSRTTVIAAYNLLRADSLITTQGRTGTWVSAAPQ